jgi:hypothetical protein
MRRRSEQAEVEQPEAPAELDEPVEEPEPAPDDDDETVEEPEVEPEAAATWESRIVGHDDVPPEQIVGNPNNWRLHPQHQSEAVKEAMDRVGWVRPVIVNRRSGNLVDGHLRVAIAIERGEATVPVDYVDLSEDQERVVLVTLDPSSSLAGTDEAQLRSLLAALNGSFDVALQKLADDLARDTSRTLPPAPTAADIERGADELAAKFQPRQTEMLDVICPHCAGEFAVNLSVRRRLSAAEQTRYGLSVRDIRGTAEEQERLAALFASVPGLASHPEIVKLRASA